METVFSSLLQFAAACLALACAEAVYVVLGFGAGLIAVGTLALIMPELRDVVVILLLVNLPAELFVVWRSWRHIQWREVAIIFVGIGVGIPIGAWILKAGDPSSLLTVLGVFLVCVGVVFLSGRVRPGRSMPRWTTPPVGLTSGLLTGLFGTGGPPLILYYQMTGVTKAAFRGHLMAIFLLMTAVRVPSYIALELVTEPHLWSALAVLPAVLLGAVIGNSIHLRLSEQAFRRSVSVALVVLGILLLIRQVA
jgi:uncharacterized membrane protein YfcA